MVLRQIAIRLALFVGIIHQISAFPAIQGHSNNLQSLSASSDIPKPAPDMVATIDQVHKILQDDPSLPRLTRGEIEELFEQVTKEEYEKSLQTGDVDRANNMRALMLVLPYNTNNTTEDNLQELYTRPPITKVIDSYSLPQPQKFQTPSSVATGKVEIVEIGNLAATTYKPSFRLKEKTNPSPTTYHPTQTLPKMPQLTTVQLPVQVPVTSLPLLPDIEVEQDKGTRYSSSYNANKPDWTLLEGEFNRPSNHYEKFTPMPDLSGVLQSMGMGFQNVATKKFKLEDYYQANKPDLSSTIKQSNPYPGTIDVADFMRTLPPRPNLEAYSEFQPLNIGEEIRIQPEVEHYLNRFGIVNRKRKQIKPEDFLETTTSKDANHLTEITKEEQPIKRIDTNVDSDSDTNNLQDQEDLVQLKKLLNNLRELERLNVSLTDDMLKSIDLSNYNLSSSIRAQGPDPVISVSDTQKNDIKRQSETDTTSEPTKFNLNLNLDETKEDSDSDSATTTTTTTTTEEPTTTTEESRNGSFSDLEGSFGGTDPVTEDPELPPPKQNGFYFLADWNSFLEVGEAGNDQVVVRFDPKIGDPRRFLKITVP